MDRSLHGWAEMFDKIQMPEKKGEYDTDIREDFKRIEAVGLPTYHRVLVEPQKFIENLNYYKENFRFAAYYAQVYPQATGLKKYNLMNFKKLSDLLPFLNENIGKYMDRYLLLVSEFEENIYGGSVMSDGNRVTIDLVEGLQNQISYGNEVAYSCVVKDNDELIYSGKCDELIRSLFVEVLDSISVLGNSKKQNYLTGYFEFAFTKKSENVGLRLVFFDYKNNSKFYM